MKKIFIAVMAMAAFAACSNENTIVTPQGAAIAFGDAFVDNSTKAIYESAEAITGFTVFGNVVATADVATATPVALYGDGAAVTRGGAALGAAWTCGVTRYWTPSCTFNFAAIANGTVAANQITNGLPAEISYTIDADDPADLIYGVATATTDPSCVPTGDVTNTVVKFTMSHLLSRVKVSFANALDEDAADYRYVISGVKIVTAGSGTYDIGTTKWTPGVDADLAYSGKTYPLTLQAEATTDCGAQLVVPTSPVDLVFTYSLELKTGADTWTPINSATITKENVISNPTQNYSYNVTVQLKAGAKIDFTVDATNGLTDFTNGDEVTVE